jgi:hypothetical protein
MKQLCPSCFEEGALPLRSFFLGSEVQHGKRGRSD